MQGGAGAMPDYELLELVLFRAIPRQDVKPLARLLIDRFGDFNRVLSAPVPRLAEVPEVRDRIEVPSSAGEDELRELALGRPNVQTHVEGKEIVKTIVVPGKLVNVVAK